MSSYGKKVISVIIVFAISIYTRPIVGIQIYPKVSELIVKTGSTLSLNCTNDESIRWSFPKGSKNFTKKIESKTVNGTYFKNLIIEPTHYLDTGYFICKSENNASQVAQIYVYCSDENSALAVSFSVVDAAMYDRAEIPCKPTSPNISVSLIKSNAKVEPIEKYDPKVGFIISTYPIIDSAAFSCSASGYRGKLKITVKVHPPHNGSSNPHIEVTDSNSNYPIFENQNVTLNCSIITSSNIKIKHLEWEFPQNIEKKIAIGNITEIRHDKLKFIGFYRILSINNVTREDQGNYTCRVIDDYSNTKVSTHSLLVEKFDSIFLNVSISEKSDTMIVKARDNSTVEFIADVQAFPKHTSTWYDPRGKKIIDSAFISDKYTKSDDEFEIKLKINAVEMKNFGTYQLKVNNSWITKTLNFTLIVEDDPKITNPRAVSWGVPGFFVWNSNYTFDCLVTGYPLPQIRWSSKSCNNYPNCGNNTFNYLPISLYKEKNIEAYEIKSSVNFKLNESIIIRCEANNSLGSAVFSSPSLLTDYGPRVVIRKNYSEPVTVGDGINVTCAVSKYRYNNSFTWIFEKNEITSSRGIQVTNSVTNFSYISTMSIANVQKNHTGRYTCQASLIDDSAMKRKLSIDNSDHFILKVEDVKTPSIIRSNMNSIELHVILGKPVNIIVQLDGNPLPLVVWYKDGEPLSFNERITLHTWHNRYLNLSIAHVMKEDEGMYSFVATNKGGSVSDKLQLLIQEENGYLYYIFGISIIFLLLIVGIVFQFIRKLHREKRKLQKILEEYGLKISKKNEVPALDPDLDIEDQTFLIPYDQKYEFPKEKLEFGSVLGSGAFGIVRKAEALGIIEKDVKTTVAVKVVKRLHNTLYLKALASELKIMIYLGQHPNVVNLLGACTKDLLKGELAIIVEYCKYGNLRSFLLKQRKNFINQINDNDEIDFSVTTIVRYENIPSLGETATLSKSVLNEETPIGSDGYLISNNELYEPEWRTNYLSDYGDVSMRPIKTVDLICWSLQAARGMEYLASRKILHGDLAARNILLTEGNIAKICDFGLAKSMYQNEEYQSSKNLFPFKWLAIESIRDRVFSTQSDVWSFGIAMWELFSLAVSPYPGLEQTSGLYEKLLSGYRMEKPKFASNEIYNLMTDCWNQCPKSRPSFTELCEKLTGLLENSAKSQYVELSKISPQETNADIYDAENYLKILGPPIYHNSTKDHSQPHNYANIPSKMTHNPGYLEMKEIPENAKDS